MSKIDKTNLFEKIKGDLLAKHADECTIRLPAPHGHAMPKSYIVSYYPLGQLYNALQNAIKTRVAVANQAMRSIENCRNLMAAVDGLLDENGRPYTGIDGKKLRNKDFPTEPENVDIANNRVMAAIADTLLEKQRKNAEVIREWWRENDMTESERNWWALPESLRNDKDMSYVFYCMISNLERHIEIEAKLRKQLDESVKTTPEWKEFFAKIPGVGPVIAATLISHLNPWLTKTVGGAWKRLGIDTVETPFVMIEDKKVYLTFEDGIELLMKGEDVQFDFIPQSCKSYHMVLREYVNADGKIAVRRSATYSPHVKAQMTFTTPASLIKSGRVNVDGKSMSAAERKMLAKRLGLKVTALTTSANVDDFLRDKGYSVEYVRSKYLQHYYEKMKWYTAKDLKPMHAAKCASRCAVKMLVQDYYVWLRTHYGLEVSLPYNERMGLVQHGTPTPMKTKFFLIAKALKEMQRYVDGEVDVQPDVEAIVNSANTYTVPVQTQRPSVTVCEGECTGDDDEEASKMLEI